jgi:hypothetical protein
VAALRTIVESAKAAAVIEHLTATFPRFEDWWVMGWSWRLARDPFIDATPIPGTVPTVYLIRTSPLHINYGFAFTLTFMYTVSDTEIEMIDIRHISLVTPATVGEV